MAILPVFQKLKGRYEFQSVLSQGGMGIIYRAYDLRVKRLVAVKTIRDTPDDTALELFERECKVLAQLSHPNVVEIFDVGEFEEGGAHKPYFVMPLLTGRTLEEVMRENPEPMPPGRSVEILSQVCRGLQSAHEQGLVHRDLKPSNIFVLDDDSVKIIDFGVAHMLSATATVGRKGTPWYMSPEQVEMEPLTPKCDQFALGVVTYQMFTGRRPFTGASEREVARAIVRQVPPPARSLNSSVSELLSQVTAKALAKKPERRWENLREFSTCLRLAYHGGPIPAFDPARFQPRLDRALKALNQGDIAFADEILRDLEDEGYTGAAIAGARAQIDESRRQTAIQQLLASARKRLEECEYPLALQKIGEILEIDPSHTEALELQRAVQEKHREEKIAQWFRIAARHLEAGAFSDAREAVQYLLQEGDPDERGRSLIAEIDRREAASRQLASQKEKLYNQALGAWQAGNLTSALARLDQLIELDNLSPGGEAGHRELYDRVRAERDDIERSCAQCREDLAQGNFDAALALCDAQLAKFPANALFQSLRIDVVDTRRRRLDAELGELNQRLAQEPGLDRRADLLQEAAARFPGEQHLRASLEAACERRDLVRSLVSAARREEEDGNHGEALAKWTLIRGLHSQYPGVENEIDRLRALSDQQSRTESCAFLCLRIAGQIESGQIEEALNGLDRAKREFPGVPEFAELERRAESRRALQSQAGDLFARGCALWETGNRTEALTRMREAQQRDPRNPQIRTALVDGIVAFGRDKVGTDWPAVRIAAVEALALDPASPAARDLLALAEAHVPAPGFRSVDTDVAPAVPSLKAASRLQTISGEPPEPPRSPAETPPARPSVWQRLRSAPKRLPSLPFPHLYIPSRIRTMSRRQAAVAGAATLLLLSGAALIMVRRHPGRPPTVVARTFRLHIRTIPPSAEVRIDDRPAGAGEVTLALSAGLHRIEASLTGYRPAQQMVRLGPGLKSEVDLALSARLSWRLYTDAANAFVTFDDGPPSEVNAGRFDFDDLHPGKHLAVVKTGTGEVRYTFEGGEKDTVVSPGAVVSGDYLAVLAKTTPGGIVLFASRPGAKASIDSGAPATVGQQGLQLPGRPPGNYTVSLVDHGERTSFPLTVLPAPALTAFVHAGRETGAVVLRTGEAGADIFVNGRKLATVTNQGETRLPGFPPGKFNILLSKQGFEPAPAQMVEIVKNKTAELRFEFKRVPPPVSQLSLTGAPGGAEIFLDQVRIGAAQDDGSFSQPDISPGTHTIELRHQGYVPKSVSLRFDAGQTTRVSGSETSMAAIVKPSSIRLVVSPPEATVTMNRPNEPPQPADAKGPISLPKGNWTFSAQAAGYDPLSLTITLGDGETREVAIKLVRKPVEKPHMLSGWQHPENWAAEGASYVREGGGFVLFDRTPLAGSVTFKVALRKGKRLHWVVAFRDEANYSDFELDRKYFARYQTLNGKTTRLAKTAVDIDTSKPVSIQISIQNGSLRHFYSTDGNHWHEIDVWTDSARNFTDGRFGFNLQSKDAIVLSEFSYYP